jgi:hypothetical protein
VILCLIVYFGDENWFATCGLRRSHEGDHEGEATTSEPVGVKVADGIYMPPGSPTSGHYRTVKIGTKRWNDNQEVTQ